MSHPLDAMTAYDEEGREVRLDGLWADRVVVLVFVRHFGCIFCRQQMADIVALRERVASMGGDIVVIGPGTIEQARAFRSEQNAAVPILTDPTRAAYSAAGMRRGLRTILTPRVLARGFAAHRRGFRQTGIAGDPLQQGGVLVMGPGGREHFRFISRESGDHPPAAQMLAAVERATHLH
jgi:peroxiredoxin